MVRAAGGVVWRSAPRTAAVDALDAGRAVEAGNTLDAGNAVDAPGGGIEVLVVHRPHRRDWSFPKGKAEPDEDDETCARREVAEETGLRCRLGPDLGRIGYADAKGRPKTVHWWAMTVESEDGGPLSADEVDELRWLVPEQAAALLSYDNDRIVLGRFLRATAPAAG